LGTAYRQLPQAWRLGLRYAGFAELAKVAEAWSVGETQEYQLKQLRIVLHHAANFCPYYQRTFAKTAFRPESVSTLDDMANCLLLGMRELFIDCVELVSTIITASCILFIMNVGSNGVLEGL